MQTVSFAGSSYNIPNQRGDTPWSGLSDFCIAAAAKAINTGGGNFTLLADINYGATFGLVSTYYKSRTANIASVGQVRLARADVIGWRNTANGGDLPLGVNSSDQLTFNGTAIAGSGVGVTSITGTANQVIASAATGAVTLSTPQNIAVTSTPTFASETLTATSSQLVLGTTRTVTVTAPTPASASRTITIPDLTGDYSVVGTIGAQTIAGDKTFSGTTQAAILNVGGAPPSIATPPFLTLLNDNNATNESLRISTYGPVAGLAAQNVIHYYRANGTAASPSAVLSGDLLSSTGWRGYASGAYTNSQLALECTATENWDSTHLGCKFGFEATPTASNTRVNVLEISGTGLAMKNSKTIDMGSAKITALANGTAATDAAAFGQIRLLQTIYGSSTTGFSTASNTYQTSNLSASITPTSSSNRVKITISGLALNNNVALSDMNISIFRGSTNLGPAVGFGQVSGASGAVYANLSFVTVDSPATTSSTTYSVKIKSADNTTTVVFGQASTQQSMVLEEIV